MWEILELLLNVLLDSCDLLDAFEFWRFFISLLSSLLLAFLMKWLMPGCAAWISFPLVGTGVALGARWEWKSRKR